MKVWMLGSETTERKSLVLVNQLVQRECETVAMDHDHKKLTRNWWEETPEIVEKLPILCFLFQPSEIHKSNLEFQDLPFCRQKAWES